MGEIMKGNPKKSALKLDVGLITKIAVPGSIILTRKNIGLNSSSFIQAGQFCRWSHVMMCLDKGDIIETDTTSNAKIKKIQDALKGVDEISVLVPTRKVDHVKLRETAESIEKTEEIRRKYGLMSLFTGGIRPALRNTSWAMTAAFAVAAVTGFVVATPAATAGTIGLMALGSGTFNHIDKLFGKNRDEMIDNMARLYKTVGIDKSKYFERISAEDHRLICSTLVQELCRISDPQLKGDLDKVSINTRPADVARKAINTGNYTEIRIKADKKGKVSPFTNALSIVKKNATNSSEKESVKQLNVIDEFFQSNNAVSDSSKAKIASKMYFDFCANNASFLKDTEQTQKHPELLAVLIKCNTAIDATEATDLKAMEFNGLSLLEMLDLNKLDYTAEQVRAIFENEDIPTRSM
jgi:hypothetical protein